MVDFIVSADIDESVLCIIDVLELSLVVDGVSYEITILVIEETSLEGSGVYWISNSSIC